MGHLPSATVRPVISMMHIGSSTYRIGRCTWQSMSEQSPAPIASLHSHASLIKAGYPLSLEPLLCRQSREGRAEADGGREGVGARGWHLLCLQ